MNNYSRQLARRYAAILEKCLTGEPETSLARSYDLGRRAIGDGLGVLEVARAHQTALASLRRRRGAGNGRARALKAAEMCLLELLSPFEATHRGFREINARLGQRNHALVRMIESRKRAEARLRRSEEHYRELFQQAQKMQERLRDLSNDILHAQERERKRLSRELHDEVGQSLTAIGMVLASLKRNLGDAAIRDATFTRLELQIESAINTVHLFATELRPAMLDELGLLPAVRSYLNDFCGRTGLRGEFRGSPAAERLDGEQKLALYRVAQESLTNAAKHGAASQVAVAFRKSARGISMTVRDNGRSFDEARIEAAKNGNRLGILGMRERIRLVNGEFMIVARPGNGTIIRAIVPLRREGFDGPVKNGGKSAPAKRRGLSGR